MNQTRSQNIFLFIVCVVAFIFFQLISKDIPAFKRQQIQSDVTQYYSFVTAVFECKDLSYKKNCPVDHYSIPTQNGGWVNKRSVGMAYMYTPFYGVSQLVAKIQGRDDDGYTRQTQNILVLGFWLYACIGIFFLGKALFRYFSYPVVSFCLFALILCTNLTWYILGETLFTHCVNFMWMSILVYATMKFYETNKIITLLVVALCISMLTIIRPNNILFGLFPVLYGIHDRASLIARFNLYKKMFFPLLLALGVFIVPIVPQLIYWKYATGQWIYYSYGVEKFYWLRPAIIDFLFSYRKGWLVYTPFMLLIIPGFIFLRKKAKEMFLPILVMIPLFIYVSSCWWAWSYGGCFGMRPMIDVYPLLIFCIASLLQLNKWYVWIPVSCFSILCWRLNMFQSWQYNSSLLHWDQMNKKTYWAIWGKKTWPVEYDLVISYPDYSKEVLGTGPFYTKADLTEGDFTMKYIRSNYIFPGDSVTHVLRSDDSTSYERGVFKFKYNAFLDGFTIYSVNNQKYWRFDESDQSVYADENDLLLASVFKMESMGHNKIVLKASNNKYINFNTGANNVLKADADVVGENSFIVVHSY